MGLVAREGLFLRIYEDNFLCHLLGGTIGTNSPVMVRKVQGTKRPGYEKSTNGIRKVHGKNSP